MTVYYSERIQAETSEGKRRLWRIQERPGLSFPCPLPVASWGRPLRLPVTMCGNPHRVLSTKRPPVPGSPGLLLGSATETWLPAWLTLISSPPGVKLIACGQGPPIDCLGGPKTPGEQRHCYQAGHSEGLEVSSVSGGQRAGLALGKGDPLCAESHLQMPRPCCPIKKCSCVIVMILFKMTIPPPRGSKLCGLENVSQGPLKTSRGGGPLLLCLCHHCPETPGTGFPDLLPCVSWTLSLMEKQPFEKCSLLLPGRSQGQRRTKKGKRPHPCRLSFPRGHIRGGASSGMWGIGR